MSVKVELRLLFLSGRSLTASAIALLEDQQRAKRGPISDYLRYTVVPTFNFVRRIRRAGVKKTETPVAKGNPLAPHATSS